MCFEFTASVIYADSEDPLVGVNEPHSLKIRIVPFVYYEVRLLYM